MFFVLVLYSVKGDVPPGIFPGLVIEYLQAGYLFIGVEIVLATLGLAGIYMMWKQRKAGLYLYASVKAINYFIPVVFIGSNHLTYPGLILSSTLIILYGALITRPIKK